MNKVYMVIILDYIYLPEEYGYDIRHRPVGIFTSLESFEESLEKYSKHICENTGKYLIVETVEIDSYIFSYEDSLIWYEYNYDTDVYEKCECPKEHKTTVGFWQ